MAYHSSGGVVREANDRVAEEAAKMFAKHSYGILAYVRTRAGNGRVEEFNGNARVIARRSYGFHSASSLIALLFPCCSGITVSPAHVRPGCTH